MHPRYQYYPPSRLSIAATKDEFLIPIGAVGDHIATHFDLVWICNHGTIQPAIHTPGLNYPGHRPATLPEIAAYRAARIAMRNTGKTYIPL